MSLIEEELLNNPCLEEASAEDSAQSSLPPTSHSKATLEDGLMDKIQAREISLQVLSGIRNAGID